MKDTT